MGYIFIYGEMCPIFFTFNGEKGMKFDKEYSTSYIDEMLFLREKGIRYTWVYVNEDNVSVWKYKKEKKLWKRTV